MSEIWSTVWPVVAALLPSFGLGWLFYVILKHILEADRRERAALRAWEADQDRAAGAATEKGGGTDFPAAGTPHNRAGDSG